MSSHSSAHAADPGNSKEMEKKVAGFVVFSGIAISILKSAAKSKNTSSSITTITASNDDDDDDEMGTIPAPNLKQIETQTQSIHTHSPPPFPPLQQPFFQSPATTPVEQNVVDSSAKTVEIVKGDTLWGLSREYGVSIEAIKEANGLTGDTIYAGKKLIIP